MVLAMLGDLYYLTCLDRQQSQIWGRKKCNFSFHTCAACFGLLSNVTTMEGPDIRSLLIVTKFCSLTLSKIWHNDDHDVIIYVTRITDPVPLNTDPIWKPGCGQQKSSKDCSHRTKLKINLGTAKIEEKKKNLILIIKIFYMNILLGLIRFPLEGKGSGSTQLQLQISAQNWTTFEIELNSTLVVKFKSLSL